MAKITSKQTFEMGISVGKNLLQIEHWKEESCKVGEHPKQENRVYLKNGQQFQIFLKNFRGIPVMVELTINGETQEETIILDPQERIFLERYLSSNNKFKFNTYELSAGLKKLIESKVELGVITARVYAVESVYSDRDVKITNTPKVQHVVDWSTMPSYYGGVAQFSTTELTNLYTAVAPIIGTTSASRYETKTNNKNGSNFVGYSYVKDHSNADMELSDQILQEVSARAEIGVIEKGAYSDQKFEGCPDFRKGRLLDAYTIHVYPVSIQASEEKKSSKIEGAIYCSVCGRKQKKGQLFCPADGTKFGE